ncbi:hypothetical protein NDU88_005715 [Pleurodeles waltl]|uniref:Uncharacterized protein n=1 Tax=Pleurodeles waltl TaxID=8319 RepID=A0AAV7VNF0_PLEWA|nr:hypothetical protein NDU88_005715 [Pleurodeles waltl]
METLASGEELLCGRVEEALPMSASTLTPAGPEHLRAPRRRCRGTPGNCTRTRTQDMVADTLHRDEAACGQEGQKREQ